MSKKQKTDKSNKQKKKKKTHNDPTIPEEQTKWAHKNPAT